MQYRLKIELPSGQKYDREWKRSLWKQIIARFRQIFGIVAIIGHTIIVETTRGLCSVVGKAKNELQRLCAKAQVSGVAV